MSTNPIFAAKLLFYSAGKKISNLPHLFKIFLVTDADYGGPFTTITGHIVLIIFAIYFQGMELTSYPDSAISGDGITIWVYFYSSVLLLFSTHMSRLKFFHKNCGPKLNSTANIICLFLGILLEKFYKESMASLYAAFFFAVFFLILFILLRPSTDLGFFGFILGAIGSISYKLYSLKAGFWIAISICFLLFCFKGWLDKNWIEEYKAGDSAFLFIVKANELIEPPKTTLFQPDQLLEFTNDPTLANDTYSSSTFMYSIVYYLKCWLARIEEERLKLNIDVGDAVSVPLITMSAEEYQLLQAASTLLNLTDPQEIQRIRDFDRDDCEAMVAAICFLIFYIKVWLENNRVWVTSANEDDDLFQVLPRFATTDLDEDQLEFLRMSNNLSLQRALHSAQNMELAMQGQALVNGLLIYRIGALRIRGETITWTFIVVFSSISVVIFITFLFSFIAFLPQFKLNLFHGRYLRRPRRS